MNGITRALTAVFSRRKSPPSTTEFELLFKSIDEQIHATAKSIRASKRAARQYRRAVIKYSSAVLVSLIAVLYFRKPRRITPEYMKEIGLVAFLPPLMFLVQRMIDWYYNRKVVSLEELLEDLKSKQDDKLAEFKEVTNFSKIRELMSKYDESAVEPNLDENAPEDCFPPEQVLASNTSSAHREDVQKLRSRGAVDRILDFMLNDGPNNRYALICSHCYTHNGLVLPEDIDTICYRCPVCGFLNGAGSEERPDDSLHDGVDKSQSSGSVEQSQPEAEVEPGTEPHTQTHSQSHIRTHSESDQELPSQARKRR